MGAALLVLQRFEGFRSAWELLPALLLHVAVAVVGKMVVSVFRWQRQRGVFQPFLIPPPHLRAVTISLQPFLSWDFNL